MSYILLIRSAMAHTLFEGLEQPYKSLYAITQSSNPKNGLELLNNYSPLKCELLHYIKADNRCELLLRALAIRYRNVQSHSFWYHLSFADVSFIKSITAENFNTMPGLLRKSEPLPPPPPTPEQQRASILADLDKATELAERLLQ